MFHPSAATDTPQGSAIQKINDVWGQDNHRGWDNYKNIGIPVCKKKYRPFEFQIKRKSKLGGGVDISVMRIYGCGAHSNIRKNVIEEHGERKGWEPFGQWSLSKAKAAARRETTRMNEALYNSATCLSVSSSSTGYDSSRSTSSEDESAQLSLIEDTRQQQPWQTLCANGSCNWKIRGKFDDISSEIEEERLSKVDV